MRRVLLAVVIALFLVYVLGGIWHVVLRFAEHNLTITTLVLATAAGLPAFWGNGIRPPDDEERRRPFMPWLH